jgi:SAM-dependent methyltransferase
MADGSEAIVAHYAEGVEADRLSYGPGQIELRRSREVLRRHLPAAPAIVADVGGGPGVHARWLALEGYEVHLLDLTPLHVETARSFLVPPMTAQVGDARQLPWADRQFAAALLLGPLYHLQDREDRLRALREAARVVEPGGIVAVAAINRFASLFDGVVRGFFADPEFRAIVRRDLADGCHTNESGHPRWFTTAFFHHPDELMDEIAVAGLRLVELVGLEGLAGWLPADDPRFASEDGLELLCESARLVEGEPTVLGVSPHLLAVCRVV